LDHFCGFDHLLRVCLGRHTGMNLFGPPGFIAQLEHRLAAYTWNLVDNYATEFVLLAHEVDVAGRVQRARFSSRTRFKWQTMPECRAEEGIVLEAPQFRVRAVPLDHHDIISLGFGFEERMHINVLSGALEQLGLPSGPWLTRLKQQVRAQAPDDTPISVHWRRGESTEDRVFPLGQLKRRVLQLAAGQKVCYVTDIADTAANRARLLPLLRDAELLFIEAVFLQTDWQLAARKSHLTAQAAGEIACAARVRTAVPFHFSARYLGREQALREEFTRAWLASP
jgi:ribonuclease Z